MISFLITRPAATSSASWHLKVIYENTEKYGFLLDEEDLYDPLTYKTITVDTTITNLAAFATRLNTNYKTLKYYNPWLRDRKPR